MPRWATWAIVAVVILLIAGPRIWPTSTATKLTYTEFLDLVDQGQIKQVEINNLSNQISGTLKDGSEFVTTGAVALSDADETLLKAKGVDYDYSTPQGNFFTNLIPLLLPFILIMGFFFWMQRRAMGQAGSIMSIGRKRGAGLGGGHDEREQTLNQLLAEMDGFETTEGVIVMAATNRPDILDAALLRPGRFDRQVIMPLPECEERLAILTVHSKGKRMGTDVVLDTMAKATPGMSGADLANLVNEAALLAVRRGSKVIEHIDFENARDRVIMGARRESLILNAEEKRATAYHEGGHAVLATVLPHSDPLHKVTILPRGMALGVTWTLPEERHTYSRDYFKDMICKAMGGRVAEMIVFGHLNSGAANDLEQATSIARRMVREWGMSDAVGPMAWSSQQQVFLGEDLMTNGREYSDETARMIDSEIGSILREQEARAKVLLEKNRAGLDLVAQSLLEQETIDGATVARLVQEGLGRPQIVEPSPGTTKKASESSEG
ncbi:MAG: ATP-dependent metallopeptidase FtsH/Yme1/Tma family protein [Actinobacteria bacterium]|nr:ATP-dependent metallopeptidase FtsH/Yme1/Tma family protein [Actinomycetota bacterium]